MGKMDFETLTEYLDDRYTPAELVDLFGIPMSDLIDCIWDYIHEYRHEVLLEITQTEGDMIQLELPFQD